MKNLNCDCSIMIDGMGFAIYSKGGMKNIPEGQNFFQSDFATPKQVAEHLKKGDIIGFNTGSGGDFNIKFRNGYPDNSILENYPIAIRLALEVTENVVSIIDLFCLMEWSEDCPCEQQIMLDDGYYYVTVCTQKPESGIWGDEQTIFIYFNQLDEMPKLTWDGVPLLFID